MNDIERGHRAQSLLDDETLTKAFADVREAIFQMIEACPIRDSEGAEKLRLQLKLLRDVRSNLEAAVSNGKIEAEELKNSREKTNVLQRVFG